MKIPFNEYMEAIIGDLGQNYKYRNVKLNVEKDTNIETVEGKFADIKVGSYFVKPYGKFRGQNSYSITNAGFATAMVLESDIDDFIKENKGTIEK